MTKTNNAKPQLYIDVQPDYGNMMEFFTLLPQTFDNSGETIYKKRNTVKKMTLPNGTPVVVKRYHKPRALNRWIYSLGLRQPKGRRAYEYPTKLKSLDIDTPAPVAYIEERNDHWLGYSFLVTLLCPYTHTLYELANANEALYGPLAHSLAGFAAHMHDSGVLHKDFTPGNILWEQQGNTFRFSIVDINRMAFKPVSKREGLLNLKKLWGPKSFMLLLAKHYARQREMDPEKAQKQLIRARKKFWTRYIQRHGAPFNIEL